MPKRRKRVSEPLPLLPAPGSAVEKREPVEVGAGVFKDRCLQLLDEVCDGAKEIVVTKHGRPVAKVVAPDGDVPSAFGFMRGTVIAEGDIVSPDHEAWDDSP